MKRFNLLFFLFFSMFYFSQNKIDKLRTETEVQDFVRTCLENDSTLSKFEIRKFADFNSHSVSDFIKKAADSLKINQSFYKGDFDSNGLMDIIVLGDDGSCKGIDSKKDENSKYYSCNFSVYCIMDFGKKFTKKNLKLNHFGEVIPKVIKYENKDYIQIFYDDEKVDFNSDNLKYTHQIKQRTLTYQFDDFIELNQKPKSHHINYIIFGTSLCYGDCPSFDLIINENRKASLEANEYNLEKKEDENIRNPKYISGHFETIIDETQFNNLSEIINYIDFTGLNSSYRVNWTDDQSSSLQIIYDDTKVKNISDYGLVGTYGLKLLYEKLFELRYSQNWKKQSN